MGYRSIMEFMSEKSDLFWMNEALGLAREAAKIGEVPIGAVVVLGDEIVASAHNLRESKPCPVAHAEMLAIQAAASKLGQWRLNECTLYVTLEPCTMCAGAIVLSRLRQVVYGATDPKAGAVKSVYQVLDNPRLNHHPVVVGGILEKECSEILSNFFAEKRKKISPGNELE